MKEILILILCCAVSNTIVSGFSLKEFDEKILTGCLDQLPGWNAQFSRFNGGGNGRNGFKLLSSSIETFISLVERLEEKHPEWNIYDLTRILLNRFGYDGIFLESQGDRLQANQEPNYLHRRGIINKLISLDTKELAFDENDLTPEEKCSLYFMIGHMVNTTIRRGIDETTNSEDGVETVKKNREQGVVSLKSNNMHAIALGRVLLGIVASDNLKQKQTIGDLYPDYVLELKENSALTIDPILGSTISEVIAYTAFKHLNGQTQAAYFGSGGLWIGPCSTDYFLHDKTKQGSTLATIRGAIDGYLIGNMLFNTARNSNNKDFMLSKVLRMYYDIRGLVGEDPSKITSYCDRENFLSKDGMNQLMESSEGFLYLFSVVSSAGGRVQGTKRDIEKVLETLKGNTIQGYMRTEDGFCNSRPEKSAVLCETMSDVFVILDDSDKGTTGIQYQADVISKLTAYLDIGLGAGSIGVYYNGRGTAIGGLQSVVHNASNRADASCQTKWIDEATVPETAEEEILITALNTTLRDFELHTAEHPHSKSKVVVLFKYSALKMTDRNRVITTFQQVLRKGHRDTRVISVGTDETVLTALATDPMDIVKDEISNADKVAEDLAKRVCNVPSVFQYELCWDNKNGKEDANFYTGYVTPDYTQYWAMYPEYFLKSYNIKFQFDPEDRNSDLEICFSRSEPNPSNGSPKEKNCKISSTAERSVVFEMNNPCQHYNVDSCPPAYFSVTGKHGTVNPRCTDPKCRRTDQIKFKFSHTGVSCNGCVLFTASPILLLLVAFTYFKFQ